MPLRRENTLSQLVLEKIQASIRDGEFVPGEMLPSEKEMSDMYGVGKSSVREAVKMLQVLGVVESSQGRGTYLKKTLGPQILKPVLFDMMLQHSSAEEVYEFRLMFDVAYLKLAVTKITDEEKELARVKLQKYKELSESHDPDADMADQEFHKVLLNSTKNNFIIKMGTLIMELCRNYIRKSNAIVDDTVMENHAKILNMLCTGDTSDIENIVANSLSVFRHTLDTDLREKSQTVD